MSFVKELRKAWQVGNLKELPSGWSPYRPLDSWYWMPEAAVDTSGVKGGYASSPAFALMRRKIWSFAEAPLVVMDRQEGQWVTVEGHPAAALIEAPNPYLPGELMWAYVLTALDFEGDAYLYKGRSASGRVVELWPLIPTYVTPQGDDGPLATPDDKGKLIAYYEYSPQGIPYRVEPEDIVHLRASIDPDNHRRGAAAMKTVLREVLTDEQAGQFAASLLKNMGVPGVILSPKDPDDPGPDEDEAERMVATFRDKFGGRRRGEPYIARGGAMNVAVVSFSPEQMNFTALRRVPEERISAVLGVPALLAHLGAGLEHATYANAAALREMMTEDTLVPLWRLLAAQFSHQLLGDFDTSPTRRLRFDLSEVRALQTDQDALWTRVGKAVAQGWVTVADARRAVGLPAEPRDEVYLRSASTVEIGEGTPSLAELEASLHA